MEINLYVKYILMSASGLLINMLIIPLLAPLFLIFFLVSLIFKLFLKLKYGNTVYKADGTDVTHGKQTPQTLPVINVAARINGNLDVNLIEERFQSMIDNCMNSNGQRRYKRLTEIYSAELGYNVWRRCDNFDIKNHIKVINLKGVMEGKESSCKEEVLPWAEVTKDLLDKYGTAIFPEEHPPWNVIVLDEKNGRYTVLFRFHHAISDGIYLSRMFYEDIIDKPYRMFVSYKPPSSIMKNSKVKFITALSPLPLQNPHKEVKMKNNFAITATTLPTPPPVVPLPKEVPLSAFPIPTTHTNLKSGSEEVELLEFQRFGSLTRLRAVEESLKKTKQNPAIFAVNSLISLFCSLFPEKLAHPFVSVEGCTMAISNLPGIPNESTVWNGVQEDQLFWVPDRNPMGAGFSILSYNGHIRVGLILDQALIQEDREGELILEDLEKELNRIIDELKSSDAGMKSRFVKNDSVIINMP